MAQLDANCVLADAGLLAAEATPHTLCQSGDACSAWLLCNRMQNKPARGGLIVKDESTQLMALHVITAAAASGGRQRW